MKAVSVKNSYHQENEVRRPDRGRILTFSVVLAAKIGQFLAELFCGRVQQKFQEILNRKFVQNS